MSKQEKAMASMLAPALILSILGCEPNGTPNEMSRTSPQILAEESVLIDPDNQDDIEVTFNAPELSGLKIEISSESLVGPTVMLARLVSTSEQRELVLSSDQVLKAGSSFTVEFLVSMLGAEGQEVDFYLLVDGALQIVDSSAIEWITDDLVRLSLNHLGSISVRAKEELSEDDQASEPSEANTEETGNESLTTDATSSQNDDQSHSDSVASDHIEDTLNSEEDVATEPPLVRPTHNASGLTFTDIDGDEGEIAGTLSIAIAADESDLEFYILYWGSDGTTKSSETPIETFAKTGSHLSHTFSLNTAIPSGASHFLVFSANDDAESASPVSLAISDVVITGSLAYSATTFNESDPENDGSISTEITVTLTGGTFSNDGSWDDGDEFDVGSGLPDGLNFAVVRDSDTQLTLSLTGNATSHANADDATFEITWNPAALATGGAASFTVSQQFSVNFTTGLQTYTHTSWGASDCGYSTSEIGEGVNTTFYQCSVGCSIQNEYNNRTMMLMRDVSIPAGSSVTSATLQFVHYGGSTSANVIVRTHNHASFAPTLPSFGNYQHANVVALYDSYAATETVPLVNAGGGSYELDVTSVIADRVGHPDWTEGVSDILLMMHPPGSGVNFHFYACTHATAGLRPKVTIQYSVD